MAVVVDVAPELLRWAVERAGWDRETAERRAPKLDEWVEGTRKPTFNQIEEFARKTHTPMGLLFLPEPPVEPVPIPDMRTVGNAVVRRPSADLLDTIYLCQDRQDWYRDYALANGNEGPSFVGSASTSMPPAEVAGRIRDVLGFGVDDRAGFSSYTGALRDLIDQIEAVGVLVMVSGVVGSDTHRTLDPQEFRGFALSDPLAPLIFVNGRDTKAAQIFTIIHELAHIWLGGSALSDASMTAKEGVAEELWCNQVAAEVLVPTEDLRADYRRGVTTEELERLAKKYRVSTLVVLKRVFDAGFLTWEQYRARYDAERERVIELAEARTGAGGGDFYNTRPLQLSRRFAHAVVVSTAEGSTTYRDAYRLLGVKKHQTFERLSPIGQVPCSPARRSAGLPARRPVR